MYGTEVGGCYYLFISRKNYFIERKVGEEQACVMYGRVQLGQKIPRKPYHKSFSR
jgi:hypothetical protein